MFSFVVFCILLSMFLFCVLCLVLFWFVIFSFVLVCVKLLIKSMPQFAEKQEVAITLIYFVVCVNNTLHYINICTLFFGKVFTLSFSAQIERRRCRFSMIMNSNCGYHTVRGSRFPISAVGALGAVDGVVLDNFNEKVEMFL